MSAVDAAPPQPSPVAPVADPRRWLTLATLCLSLVIIVMDNSILNVAIPALVRDLGASTSQLQWIIDSYVLVFAGFLLTAGTLGDRYGRKGALTIGLVIFAGGSALAAFSTGTGSLTAFRALMGFGAAFIMPATLSILTNVFRDPKERAQAIAIWAAFAGVGGVIGPIAGGFLLEHFSWHSVFWINLPVVAIALVAGWKWVPRSRDEHAPAVDWVGAGLSIGALVTLVYAIIEVPHLGWTDPVTLVAFGLAAVFIAAFVVWEYRTPHPMLDIRFFKSRRFSGGNLAITMTFFAMFGSFFLLTQYLQFILGYTALETGVRMIPMALVMFVVAPLSAKIVEKVGTTPVVVTGLALVAAGLAAFSTLDADLSYGGLIWRLVVLASGMGMVMAPATEAVMGSLPPEKAGVGSAVNDTTREVGGALGVAVVGAIVSSYYVDQVRPVVEGLPAGMADAADAVKSGIGPALHVAAEIPGAAGTALADQVTTAFVDALSKGMIIGAVIAAIAAVIVGFLLPRRGHDWEHPSDVIVEEVDRLEAIEHGGD